MYYNGNDPLQSPAKTNTETISEPNQNKKTSSTFSRIFSMFLGVALIGGIAVGSVHLYRHFKGSEGSSSFSNPLAASSSKAQRSRPKTCPEIDPSKRVIVFWQSEHDGCETIPDGVTHVFWGFSEVQDGATVVDQTFQTTDQKLTKCIQALRKRCIYSFASVGGAENNKGMAGISDYPKFAQSVLSLLEKFAFDGVDIDDETTGPEFNVDRVLGYMKEVHKLLKASLSIANSNNKESKGKGKDYGISFDGLIMDGVKSFCSDPDRASYTRCFPPELMQYIDFVNIMAYNIDRDVAIANKIYGDAVDKIFKEWTKEIFAGDATRGTVGVCVGGGCAYGPGPNDATIENWASYAKTAGGMMLYSASADSKDSYHETKNLIKLVTK